MDGALVGLDLPVELPEQVAGSLRARVAWRGEGAGELVSLPWSLVVSDGENQVAMDEGQSQVRARERRGDWFLGSMNLPLPKLPAGVFGVEVVLQGMSGDRALENQKREGLLRVGSQPLVVIVDSGASGGAAETLVRGLEGHGILAKASDPSGFERWLSDAQVLVTLDLATDELPAAQVAGFVARGGSWLALGEEGMLPGWSGRSWQRSGDLSALLPLDVDPGSGPDRDVILLVDGSGSMEGEPWSQVQAATLTLLRSVPRRVAFEVDLFTHELLDAKLRLEVAPEDAGAKDAAATERALRTFLSSRVPGGKTNIMKSLMGLLDRRAGSGPSKTLLITDGWQNDGGSWDPESLRARLAEEDMELAIVATSENPNLDDLELLIPRERIRLARDLEGLAELLEAELLGDLVRREANMAVRGAGRGAAWGIPNLIPNGGAFVRSLVRTRPRAGAQVLLATERGE
ncbi:MAG: VWA domain-containing protein, partial [Planctomycetes bacterium]|nr:VWA domain-containing protein [Planctomycetota bacterium]